MSPVGLDSREYAWGFIDVTLADGAFHVISNPSWLVTRVQIFAAAAAASFQAAGGLTGVAANGCLELLPGGAMRGSASVSGLGARFIIEFWWKATEDGIQPPTTVT